MSLTPSSRTHYFMYGADMSLFSGKARSYLRKKRVSFETRSTSHPGYARAVQAIGHAYQPILETIDGEFVQDTTAIIDFVEARSSEASVYPTGAVQRLVGLLFELYGDEGLLKPAMHYRWNFPESNDAFLSSEFARGVGKTEIPLDLGDDPIAAGRARWKLVSGHMRNGKVPAYGVNPKSIPAIEAAYADLLDALADHFGAHPYLLGGRPCIGDFGLMAPLYAHLGRDPEPVRLMKERAPMVYRWVERMNASDPGMAEFPQARPEFLDADEIPETLLPVLALMARDYLPELLSIFAAVESWLAAHPETRPGDPVPGVATGMGSQGALGTHEVELRGVRIEQAVRYYSIWMAQRPLDHYRGLTGAERERADRLIDEVGLRALFDLSPSVRIERRGAGEYFAKP